MPTDPGGLEEAVVELAALADVGDLERAVAAANLAVAAGVALHALEDRQHVLIAPAAVAELGPVVVVLALAAHPHHAVDGARAAQHAPARHRDRPPAGVGLGLGGVEPIDARPRDELGKADRHARERMRLAAGLEQQHLMATILGEAVGERGTCRSGADDDEIDSMLVHAFPQPPFSLRSLAAHWRADCPNLAHSSLARPLQRSKGSNLPGVEAPVEG